MNELITAHGGAYLYIPPDHQILFPFLAAASSSLSSSSSAKRLKFVVQTLDSPSMAVLREEERILRKSPSAATFVSSLLLALHLCLYRYLRLFLLLVPFAVTCIIICSLLLTLS